MKVVFIADAAVGNLIDNQIVFSRKLGLNPDEACKDGSRGAFLTTRDDVIFIDEERLINYESEDFGKKYDDEYHAGHSQSTLSSGDLRGFKNKDTASSAEESSVSQNESSVDPCQENYNGVPYLTIIEAWSKQRFSGSNVSRHEASVVLARDLYIMTDRNKQATLALLMAQKWVQEIVQERQEDVERTVNNAARYRRR